MKKKPIQKKISLTPKQLSEAIAHGIILHEKRKMVKRAVLSEATKQMKNKILIEKLMNEGPLGNAWAGIKAGTKSALSGLGQAWDSTKQAAAQGARAEHAKEIAQSHLDQVQKGLQNVSKVRQKYMQGALKNTADIQSYHDAVLGLVNTWVGISQALGDEAGAIALNKHKSTVASAVQQIAADFAEERNSIEQFLNDLKANAGEHFTVNPEGAFAEKQARDTTDNMVNLYKHTGTRTKSK